MRIFIIIALFIVCLAPSARADETYTVNNVAVDVDGKNAIEARDLAMTKARRDAFGVLASRLMTPEERAALPTIDDNVIASMVNDFEINREKYSKNRYLASVNIAFNPHAIQGYLGRYTNVALTNPVTTPNYSVDNTAPNTALPASTNAQNAAGSLLVLPWYGMGSDATLWRDPNPWRAAWVAWAQTAQARNMNIVIPIGDITDMQAFNPSKPLMFDHDELHNLLKRYNATQAIIAMADPLPNGMVRVSLYQSTSTIPRYIDRIVSSGGTMTGSNQFLPAIYQSVESINSKAPTINASLDTQQTGSSDPSFTLDNTHATAFEVEIQLATIQQWIGIKQSLAVITGINDLQVKSLRSDRAVVSFLYTGDPETLRRDLQQRGLSLYANPVQANGTTPYIITRNNG